MAVSVTSNVPERTSNLIADYAQEAKDKSAQDIQAERLAGTDTIKDVGAQDPFKGQFVGGVDSDALIGAIKQRALGATYGADQAAMKSEVLRQSVESRLNRLTNSAQMVNAEQQQNERARMNRYIKKQNRKSKRAGVLGNVLGIAGAAAGAFFGGPAGAAAGYQIGQGTGQALG